MLHDQLKEVEDEAALLGVERAPSEAESVFRTRVAYALLIHARNIEGLPTAQLTRKLEWWTKQGKLGREPLLYEGNRYE
jgi:hypothetical protein